MIVGIIAAVKSSPNITGIKIDKIIDSIITKKKLQNQAFETLDVIMADSFSFDSDALPNNRVFIDLGIEFNPLNAVVATNNNTADLNMTQ